MRGRRVFRSKRGMVNAIRDEGIGDLPYIVERPKYHDGTFYKPVFQFTDPVRVKEMKLDGWDAVLVEEDK